MKIFLKLLQQFAICAAFFILSISFCFGQNQLQAYITDAENGQPLPGSSAYIKSLKIGASADSSGFITINDIPDGKFTVVFSFIGYKSYKTEIAFPTTTDLPLQVKLEPAHEELEEIIVSATRTSRMIDDIPTRVEAITSEELEEKAVMNSSNIAMVLRESTGILVQQTSANSANASIRIQGLDGRYTQILRDGFPLYGGFSSGLSIMQIPPLDLHQVEVIKGSASTLYGGGAIAGLVNLVSKTPQDEPELSFMVNQTTAGGTTANAFYSQDYGKPGVTFYTSATRQFPFDANNDNFSEIPDIKSISVNPRFFYEWNNTKFNIGVNTAIEERAGGDMSVLKNQANELHVFQEVNKSLRNATIFDFRHQFTDNVFLEAKNSFSWFSRDIEIPGYKFSGNQTASFSEITLNADAENTSWIGGVNFVTDDFREKNIQQSGDRSYQYTTAGAFLQNTYNAAEWLTLETGLRTDYNVEFGSFVLPRLSVLFKISDKITSRVGGGLGYKLPTIFTEDAERLAFNNIVPIRKDSIKAEKSAGLNFDLNYQTSINENLFFTINQMFFHTRVDDPLLLNEANANQQYVFFNSPGQLQTSGFETNIKMTYLDDFKLFLNYAFIDTYINTGTETVRKPLTPKHNAGMTLMYEDGEKWRIGYELYYIGSQYLTNRTLTPDYWMMGFMVMRTFKKISLFINFENFTDTRLSRFQQPVLPPIENPSFTEIWAPTDGFIANGGFKISVF